MNPKNIFKTWAKWLAYDPSEMPKVGPKVVVIGGGTGLAKLLEGLKEFTHNLSAIVTVYDSGGSSGKLRQDFNIPALGDLRNCILALAEKEDVLREVFDYRFEKGEGLEGHPLGNLFLTALLSKSKNLDEASRAASEILKIKGRVYPSSLDNAHLWAYLSDNSIVKNEAKIVEIAAKNNLKIKKIELKPEQIANKHALLAIREANLIIIGPGSLYTSVLPNFLVKGIKEAVNESKAIKLNIMNVAQERGETMGMDVIDHLEALLKFGVKLDFVLVNSKILRHAKDITILGEVENITTNRKRYKNIEILHRDIISKNNPLYHNSKKLAEVVIQDFLK